MDELIGRKELEALVDEHGRALVLAAARAALERAREEVKAGLVDEGFELLPADELVHRRKLPQRVRGGHGRS